MTQNYTILTNHRITYVCYFREKSQKQNNYGDGESV